MHRSVLSIALVVCALGTIARAQAPTATTPDGWVVLGVDEYRALRERASPLPPRPDAPPVEATLSRIDYDLRVDGDTVAGRALLTIDALRDGWTRVEIPTALMARDARIDGQPVPMHSGDRPAILISRAGRSMRFRIRSSERRRSTCSAKSCSAEGGVWRSFRYILL